MKSWWISISQSNVAVVAIAGTLVTVLLTSLTTLLGAQSWIVLLGLTATATSTLWLILRAVSVEMERIENLRFDHKGELEAWQDRWQQLQDETREATSALARMRDGVIMLSSDFKVMLINPAGRKLLKIREDQNLESRFFSEVVRIPELTRAFAAAVAGDGVQKLLLEMPHNGEIRPLKIRVQRFSTTGNDNLLVTVRDETETHRVDEMRREFIANVSHEIKTPLAAIKGYAETVELAIKDDPEVAVHFMSQIQTECVRLERLVADMMQLARAQSGRNNLDIHSINMCDAIAETLKSYRPTAVAKQIDLSHSETEVPSMVLADTGALLTITNNLVGNALRYTPDGGRVTVSCRDAGNCWALVVEDTGVGIAETDQKRIFERFYRVRSGRESGDGGTGIGLSIVRNLTVTLKGEVRVSSRPRHGSKFEVLLPKADV